MTSDKINSGQNLTAEKEIATTEARGAAGESDEGAEKLELRASAWERV